MIDDILFDRVFRGFCQTVIRNHAINIHKHESYVQKPLVALDEVIELSRFQNYFSYREQFEVSGVSHTFHLLGVTFTFADENLVHALNLLPPVQQTIVLLYYVLEKTDEEICNLLNMKHSTVHYKRQNALKRLKYLMNKMSG